jgi:hypothetical protein
LRNKSTFPTPCLTFSLTSSVDVLWIWDQVLIKEEDTVTVGQDCFVIDQGAAGSSPAAEKKESAPVKKPAPAEGKSESKKAQKPSTESSQQKAAPKPASKPPPAPKATQKPSSEVHCQQIVCNHVYKQQIKCTPYSGGRFLILLRSR